MGKGDHSLKTWLFPFTSEQKNKNSLCLSCVFYTDSLTHMFRKFIVKLHTHLREWGGFRETAPGRTEWQVINWTSETCIQALLLWPVLVKEPTGVLSHTPLPNLTSTTLGPHERVRGGVCEYLCVCLKDGLKAYMHTHLPWLVTVGKEGQEGSVILDLGGFQLSSIMSSASVVILWDAPQPLFKDLCARECWRWKASQCRTGEQ